MKTVSQSFKNKAKSNSRVELAKYEISGTDIVVTTENITKGFIQEIGNVNDSIIGNTVAKNLEFELINDDYDYNGKEITFYTGLINEDGEEEYVKHGTFIIDNVELDIPNNTLSLKGMDYMVKFNVEFVDNLNWEEEHTLGEYAQYLCNFCGVELATTNFPNSSYVLTEKPAFDGYQCRYVLGKIAEISGCSAFANADDKIEIKLRHDSEIYEEIPLNNIIDMSVDYVEYKPINAVMLALADGVEGENVTLRDEESIALYGENCIRINANEFAINQEVRIALIQEIFDYLKGFYYVPLKITYNSLDYLDRTDNIRVYFDENEYYDSIVLNHTIEFPATIKSILESNRSTSSQEKYEYTPEVLQKLNRTEIVVDKLKQEILTIIEKQEEQIIELEKVSQLFNVSLDYNVIDVPINEENKPLNITENIRKINYVAKFRSSVVTDVVVTTSDEYEGITVNTTGNMISFEFDPNTTLLDSNEYMYNFSFTYKDDEDKYYTLDRRIILITETTTYTTLKNQDSISSISINLNNVSNDLVDNYYRKEEIDTQIEEQSANVSQITRKLERVETDSAVVMAFKEQVEVNGVTKVDTQTGFTFDENGMKVEKSGAKTNGTFNELGVQVNTNSGTEMLFAGYDTELQDSIVRTNNLTVKTHLIVGNHLRVENYKDQENDQEGTGFFHI